MHVHIIYTGGTIGMVDSPHGLVPGADLEGWLTSLLEGTPLARSVSVTSLDPLIDSSNATPESWQAIVDDLRAHAERALPHYALPRRLEIIDEMPRSVIGKVMRRQVREMLEGR